jgi:NitT/TauT family transport system permease protein
MKAAEAEPELKAFSPIRLPSFLPAVLCALGFVVMWQGSVVLFSIPAYIVPTPSSVVVRVYQDLASGLILPHFWATFVEVGTGFAMAVVIGVGLGTVIGLMPKVDKAVYPLLLAFQTIPKVAIAPLLVIWFGYGLQSKAVMAALIAFFPILVNVIAGLKTTDTRRLLLMRALRASATQTYFKVRVPSMLPYLFAGLEVGIVFALIGAIVGEFVGSSVGLGSLIIQRQAVVDVDGVFSILTYLSLMGLFLSFAVKLVASRTTFWEQIHDRASQ